MCIKAYIVLIPPTASDGGIMVASNNDPQHEEKHFATTVELVRFISGHCALKCPHTGSEKKHHGINEQLLL